MSDDAFRIVRIELDEHAFVRRSPDVEQERAIAIFDLLEENAFAPVGDRGGPYHLLLGISDSRLVFDVRREDGAEVDRILLPLLPLRQVIRDYFTICQSYYEAIKHASPSRIEALDMGRRAVHDEGSERLRERLADKAVIDFQTARRLFTLVCVLHFRPARGEGA
jgi:uncharacterized protein (UPF0262 family)